MYKALKKCSIHGRIYEIDEEIEKSLAKDLIKYLIKEKMIYDVDNLEDAEIIEEVVKSEAKPEDKTDELLVDDSSSVSIEETVNEEVKVIEEITETEATEVKPKKLKK